MIYPHTKNTPSEQGGFGVGIYLLRMALRNVFRNRRRSFLTGFSIVFAVAIVIFMWSFAKGETKSIFDVFIRFQSGNIRVVNPEYVKHERMLPLIYNISNYDSVQSLIAKNPKVKISTGRIRFGVLLEYKGETKQTLGIGIDPIKEEEILELSKKMVQGRLIGSATDEVNIGVTMAKELGLKLGDTLTVVTQTAYGSISAKNLKIAGIFNYGSPAVDRRTFFIPLGVSQDLLDLGRNVTEIFVILKDPENARKVASAIDISLNKGYTVKAWQDQGVIYSWMKLVEYIYMLLYAIILLLSAFTIFNTMFMAVLERTREIGMMKALGMRNRQLIGVILLEAMVLGVIASGIGAIFGALLSYYITIYGIDITAAVAKMEFPIPNIYYGVFSWTDVLTGFLVGVVCAILAAVFPALRAAKLQPMEALHEI